MNAHATLAITGSAGSGRTSLAQVLAFPYSVLDLSDTFAHDLLIVVASASQGVDGAVAAMWEHAADLGKPRLLVISHLDVGRTDDDEIRLIAERVLGEEVLPYCLPLADDEEEMAGTLTLSTLQIHDDIAGITRPADDEHVTIAHDVRERLIEAVLSNTSDEALVSKALLGLSISPEQLDQELVQLTRNGVIALSLPVIPVQVNARPRVGLDELNSLITRLI